MDYTIRHMKGDEHPLLEDFLYEAIFVPEDFEGEIPRSIIHDDPKCRAAYEGFGKLPDDRALVAEVDGHVIGACWVRTTDEYGHIDDATPSFSISLYEQFRGQGIGGALMRRMLDELRDASYVSASLSVQKENPALRLYERLGFRIIGDGEDETEWMMVIDLASCASLMHIRKATEPDLSRIMEIYAIARVFMAEHGNPDQWGPTNWPPEPLVRNDIAQGKSFVCELDGRIVGVFFFDYGKDIEPAYACIEGGSWLDDGPYGVVHRIASDGSAKGVGSTCIDWAFRQCGHLRIDTHGDNAVMQGLLEKLGFVHCGTIYVEEDDNPRLAFEKTIL